MSFAANKYIVAFVALALALSLLAPGLANVVNAASFNDVAEVDSDIQADIQILVDAGILTGYNGGTEFHPFDQVKRAQVAKIIVETMDWAPNAAAAAFPDVTNPEDKGYIGALVEHGVATGYGDGTFGPYDNVTRQQLASFFMRALGLAETAQTLFDEGTIGLDFIDADTIDESHKANVALANEIGFLQGYPDGTFGPTRYAARTALAKFGANLYVEERRQGFLDAAQQLDAGVEKVTGVALSDGPDLVSVEADGKYVTYTFDEEVDEIDENGFFLYIRSRKDLADSDMIEDASIVREDKTKVEVEFIHEKYVRLAGRAGVEEGAATDEENNDNLPNSLPLQDVNWEDGQSLAPSLIDFDIDSFEVGDDSNQYEIVPGEENSNVEAEFTFDYENTVVDDTYAPNFILYFEDGSKLVGTGTPSQSDETVTIKVYAPSPSDGGPSGDSGFDEDDLVKAVVLPGTVAAEDGNEENQLTAYEIKGNGDVEGTSKKPVADLEDVEIDAVDEELVITFDEDIESILNEIYNNDDEEIENAIREHFAVVNYAGLFYPFTDSGSNTYDITDIDGDEITIEMNDGNPASGAVAAVVVGEIKDDSGMVRVALGEAANPSSSPYGSHGGPLLESAVVDNVDDEEVTVLFYFNKDLEDDAAGKKPNADHFILYTADGDDYAADKIEEVDDNVVEVTFEIDEDDFEEVVLAAIMHDEISAVYSDENVTGSPVELVELEK